MRPEAKLVISTTTVNQTSYYETIDEAKKVLQDYSDALRRLDKLLNDEEVVFQYQGLGAIYCVDLRKCVGASVEVIEDWAAIQTDEWLRRLTFSRGVRAAAENSGLGDELERHEKLQVACGHNR